MSEYDVNVRSLETEYAKTIDRDVKKKLDDETLTLSRIIVTVKVEWRSSGDIYSTYFDVLFRADHDERVVETKSISDAHGEIDSLSFDKQLVATHTAERAVASFIDSIGLDYGVLQLGDAATLPSADGVGVDVFNDQDEI